MIPTSIPVLAGLGISLALAGMIGRLGGSSPGEVPPIAAHLVVAAALAALAMGIRTPLNLALWHAAWLRARLGRGGAVSGAELLSPPGWDAELAAKVYSIVLLLAGAAAALLPWQARIALSLYQYLHTVFVWSDIALVPLQFAVGFVGTLVPFSLLGLALAFAQRMGGGNDRLSPRVPAGALMGVAAGLAACGLATGNPNVLLAGSSLPVLFSALLFGMLVSERPREHGAAGALAHPLLPAVCDEHPFMLRLTVLSASAALAVAGYGALQIEQGLAPAALAFAAGGMLWPVRMQPAAESSSRGLVRLTMAGAILLFVLAVFQGRNVLAYHLTLLCAFGVLGCAAAEGHRSLMRRVPDRSPAGVVMLARGLLLCSLLVAVVLPLLEGWLGRGPVLMLGVVALGCAAGALAVQDRPFLARERGALLIVAGAGVGAATLVITCL